MIASIRQQIKDKLSEVYPITSGYTIYDEDNSQDFVTNSFLLTLVNQKYSKRWNNKFTSLLSFKVDYFSGKPVAEIRADCLAVQLNLFRAFDLIETYRVQNKQAVITDNVLHFTFDISYSEIITETVIPMQRQQTNAII